MDALPDRVLDHRFGRAEVGQPYLRMAISLGVVAPVTLLSALLFETRNLRRVYGLKAVQNHE